LSRPTQSRYWPLAKCNPGSAVSALPNESATHNPLLTTRRSLGLCLRIRPTSDYDVAMTLLARGASSGIALK
jgi:hypothetical protein